MISKFQQFKTSEMKLFSSFLNEIVKKFQSSPPSSIQMNRLTTSSSTVNRNQINKIKTPMTTWSLMMATFYFLLLFSCTTSTIFWHFANAKPYSAMEFYRPYDHRSAMNTLKELDKYYSQIARPR